MIGLSIAGNAGVSTPILWFLDEIFMILKSLKAIKALFSSEQALSTTSSSEQTIFKQALLKSKTTTEMMPVWELFVITQFFVVILRDDEGEQTKDFRFAIFNNPIDEKPYVTVSENLESLNTNAVSQEAIKVSGAKLIEMLQPELGIVIGGLEEGGGFCMPGDVVQWLRASIQPA